MKCLQSVVGWVGWKRSFSALHTPVINNYVMTPIILCRMFPKPLATVEICSRPLVTGASTEGDVSSCFWHPHLSPCQQFQTTPQKKFLCMPMDLASVCYMIERKYIWYTLMFCLTDFCLGWPESKGYICWQDLSWPSENADMIFEDEMTLVLSKCRC